MCSVVLRPAPWLLATVIDFKSVAPAQATMLLQLASWFPRFPAFFLQSTLSVPESLLRSLSFFNQYPRQILRELTHLKPKQQSIHSRSLSDAAVIVSAL
jgi:hypothetical protein